MAKIRKRGKSWVLDWRDSSGRHQKSLGNITQEMAKILLKRKEYELAVGLGGANNSKIVFRQYADEYLAFYEQQYPSSFQTVYDIVIKSLEVFFADFGLAEITPRDVERYIATQKDKIKPATINRRLAVLSAMLSKAKKDGYRVADIKIERVVDLESKPPKYYSHEELDLIYQNAENHWHWWKFLANTGMRLGEFYQLRCKDVQADGVYILSTNTQRSKSGKWRKIPLSKGAKIALKEFDLGAEYLIPRLNKSSIKTAYKRACVRAGIAKGKHGVHCLRHTFASNLVMDGTPLHVVQKLLGHASIKTTEQYAHLSADYLQASVDGVDF